MRSPSPPTRLDPIEDQRLVARCLEGDARAWAELVERHERLVYAVARAYRLSENDLRDVFQEVFLALVQGLPRLREPRALVRWLSSTTQRIARATALRRRREAALAVEAGPGALDQLPAEREPVGVDLERLEEQALLRMAMGSLRLRCRELLQALYFEDPSPAYLEIGRRLGLPVGSIGPTRARCFEGLRDAYRRLSDDRQGISIKERLARTSLGSARTKRVRLGSPGVGRETPHRNGKP